MFLKGFMPVLVTYILFITTLLTPIRLGQPCGEVENCQAFLSAFNQVYAGIQSRKVGRENESMIEFNQCARYDNKSS